MQWHTGTTGSNLVRNPSVHIFDKLLTKQQYLLMYCTSMVSTLTLSSDSRAFIDFPNSRKISQPSHRAIFSEHPVSIISFIIVTFSLCPGTIYASGWAIMFKLSVSAVRIPSAYIVRLIDWLVVYFTQNSRYFTMRYM